MIELILHGIGDYFLQTDKQAVGKKHKGLYGFKCCLIHCITYSLPFLFIGSYTAVLAIFISHFIIDRSNLVAYIIAIKNDTKKPRVPDGKMEYSFPDMYDISNFGYGLQRPFALSIWLYIICDNLLHIICNHLALRFL